MQAQFAKYTQDDLKQLLRLLRELQAQRKDFEKDARRYLNAVLGDYSPPYFWATFYEHSLIEHIAILAVVSGQSDNLLKIAEKDDPQKALLGSLEGLEAFSSCWQVVGC